VPSIPTRTRDSSLLQALIELPGFSIAVMQSPFTALACVLVQKRKFVPVSLGQSRETRTFPSSIVTINNYRTNRIPIDSCCAVGASACGSSNRSSALTIGREPVRESYEAEQAD
jgi:hypothetical protein